MPDAEWAIKTAGGGSYTPPGSTTPVDLTAWTAAQLTIFGEWDVDTAVTANSALQLPVTSNNFKDMIHGIHSGRDRVSPWKDARYFRNNQTLLDFRRMEFPGVLNNCETCHIAGTYNRVLANSLVSNHYARSDAFVATPTVDLAGSSRAQVNDQDTVITPFAAACTSCHDGSVAQSHMRLNGAVINGNRTVALGAVESCATCHGSGREYDPAVVHK
jgi:OmcA/MtrC family decaheme c-type cytochrome